MKTKNRSISVLLLLTLILTMLFGSVITVNADNTSVGTTPAEAYQSLLEAVCAGDYTCAATGKPYDYDTKQYKTTGGGYLLYTEITDSETFLNGTKYETLTSGAKQEFLKDILSIANAMAYDTGAGNIENSQGVTTDTVNDMMKVIQNKAGMGSQLLATLLSETKPNYASANKLYKPFSGVVGTLIALVAILIMSLLGLTMALDIAYITIPAFQMAMGGSEEGGQNGKKGGIGGIISAEAKQAVKASEGGGNGQNGDGYKAAVGIYLKYRWKGLVLLGICLLYLVQGQIYSFVAWFIDLFSGFLGF